MNTGDGWNSGTGYPPLSVDEITEVVDALNRAGPVAGGEWVVAVSLLRFQPRTVRQIGGHWSVILNHGETFTHSKDLGWLYIGVTAQVDGEVPHAELRHPRRGGYHDHAKHRKDTTP